MSVSKIKTPVLQQAFERSGPKKGEPLILVHGWPDSPRTFDRVIPGLHETGYQTIVPYLRGYGPSTFRGSLFGKNPRRTGQPVVFAQDMINLADRLDIERFHFIGHDWGARTGYALAALFPKRLRSLTAISVPFKPGKATPPKFPQAHAFWYQWLLCTKPGETKFREDVVAFGQAQWDVWSPPGWYKRSDLEGASEIWQGKDFQDVVLHGYRSRWGHAEQDPCYATLQSRLDATKTLSIPTLLLHGREDRCELVANTEGAERYFTAPYHRVLLDGVGHFPQRENPALSTAILREHLRQNANS